MSFHSDAASGALTSAVLDDYLKTWNINERSAETDNSTTGLTPLALAARNGHVETVRLLLERGAKADAYSSQRRTPLWIVTLRGRGDGRPEIIQLLLRYGADAAYSDPDLQNGATPLENELKQQKNLEVIKLLVKNGGKTDAAVALATNLGRQEIIDVMEPAKQRARYFDDTVAYILGLILFVIAWVNTALLTANAFFDKYRISGTVDDPTMKDVKEKVLPLKNKEEFKQSINNFVAESKLGKFFDRENEQLLERITAKAVELQNDSTSVLGEPANTENLVKFALYQPVIYCDDSGSMNPINNDQAEDRMSDQRDLVRRIGAICTKIVPDDLGVHLRFINSRPDDVDNLRMAQIQKVMDQVKPTGCTEIGTQLRERILQPLLYSQYNENVKELKRPLFISIITDGIPFGGSRSLERLNTLRDEIVRCQDYLLENGLPLRTVVFQISQIGSDPSSKDFLQKLKEENLENVYITAQQLDSKFRELRDNERDLEAWLFQTLLAPILDTRSD